MVHSMFCLFLTKGFRKLHHLVGSMSLFRVGTPFCWFKFKGKPNKWQATLLENGGTPVWNVTLWTQRIPDHTRSRQQRPHCFHMLAAELSGEVGNSSSTLSKLSIWKKTGIVHIRVGNSPGTTVISDGIERNPAGLSSTAVWVCLRKSDFPFGVPIPSKQPKTAQVPSNRDNII